MRFLEFIRSVIFSLYLFISIPAFGAFIILLPILFFRPSFKYEVARAWSQSVLLALKIICEIEYEIRGLENLPKKKGFIIIYNHLLNHNKYLLKDDFQITLDSHFIVV